MCVWGCGPSENCQRFHWGKLVCSGKLRSPRWHFLRYLLLELDTGRGRAAYRTLFDNWLWRLCQSRLILTETLTMPPPAWVELFVCLLFYFVSPWDSCNMLVQEINKLPMSPLESSFLASFPKNQIPLWDQQFFQVLFACQRKGSDFLPAIKLFGPFGKKH